MSAEQDITDILDDIENGEIIENTSGHESAVLALQEVKNLLSATDDSLLVICLEAEKARSKAALKAKFRRFNKILRLFLEAAPDEACSQLVRDTVLGLPLSDRFKATVLSSTNFSEAATTYKTSILQDLAVSLRRWEKQGRLDQEKDDEIFSQFFPEEDDPSSKVGHAVGDS